jgi:hypothetical protein
MNFLTKAHKHPPEDDDEPKTPRQPGTKEPEPDIPDSDEERHILETPVQVRSGLRPSL